MDCILSTLSKHSLQRTCKLNWLLNVQENIAYDSNELSKWNGEEVYGSGYPGQQNAALEGEVKSFWSHLSEVLAIWWVSG